MSREQSVSTPNRIETNYTIIGASHDQEKLPKYPPIFVTVGIYKYFMFLLVEKKKKTFRNFSLNCIKIHELCFHLILAVERYSRD